MDWKEINTEEVEELTLDVTHYEENSFIILAPSELKDFLLRNNCVFAKLNGQYEESLSLSDRKLLESKHIEKSNYSSYLYIKLREIENLRVITDKIFNCKNNDGLLKYLSRALTANDLIEHIDNTKIMLNRPRNYVIRQVLKKWQLSTDLIELFFNFYPDDLQNLIDEFDIKRVIPSC